jgi:RNA polymerase sigma-70 factor (ECF subfamily)
MNSLAAPPQPDPRFNEFLSEYRGIFVKIARAYTFSPEDRADLDQEMQLQVWRSLQSFRGQARPSTWIYRICLNTALGWRREAVTRERRFERGAEFGNIASDAASPAEGAADQELLDQLYAAIHQLSAFNRALVLLLLDGLAYREIAEITGLTENNVGVALTRARHLLAKQMKGAIDELE